MQHEEDSHEQYLKLLEDHVAKANEQAKQQGLLSAPATAEETSPGKAVQDFQKLLEAIYPMALADPTLQAAGIAKDTLDYIFKGQLLTAHHLSIQAELTKVRSSEIQVPDPAKRKAAEITPVEDMK